MGYAGGQSANPTYRDLGDHSEAIQIDYDPAVISYEELLAVFWNSHSPTSRPWSRQYASFVFYHNEEQKRLAEETRDREVSKLEASIFTEIVPFAGFYQAEDYHQKYRLQQDSELMDGFRAIYPDHQDFVDSTVVARVNGYVGGYGSVEAIQAEIDRLDLSAEDKAPFLEIVSRLGR